MKSINSPAGRFVQLGLMLGALVFYLFFVHAAEAATWLTNSPMNTKRYWHTATLMPDGKVLIVGGNSNGGYLSSAELYDPNNRTWTPTTNALHNARAVASATLLPNGNVLVAGGYSGSIWLSSSELYDSMSGSWAFTSNNFSIGRSGHSATLLPNGKVLIAGGYDGAGSTSSAEIFDLTTGLWSTTESMAEARRAHTATLLANGKVLVTGGFGSSSVTAKTEIYDPSTETWLTNSPMNTPRASHCATLLPNGQVLVAGGFGDNSSELYDPSLGTWTLTNTMTSARVAACGNMLSNGQVLMTGGENGACCGRAARSSTEVFNPLTGTWTPSADMRSARASHSATLLQDGTILVAGGMSTDFQVLSSTELYVEATPIFLVNPVVLPSGTFKFNFTNTPSMNFDTWATTNLSLPISNWTALGGVTEISPGQFQFTDSQATNFPQRFYRVREN